MESSSNLRPDLGREPRVDWQNLEAPVFKVVAQQFAGIDPEICAVVGGRRLRFAHLLGAEEFCTSDPEPPVIDGPLLAPIAGLADPPGDLEHARADRGLDGPRGMRFGLACRS